MQHYRKLLLILLLISALVLAACDSGDDEEETEVPPTEDTSAEVAEDEEEPEVTVAPEETEAPAEAGNIPEVATEAGDFTTLLAAVEAADLAETLSGDGPFTVFAPTDDAFAALLEELGVEAEDLLAREDLADILLYHVVSGEVMAADVVELDGEEVETVQGGMISISVDGETVMLNDTITVTAVDVAASNGVIHVIDGVLLPPADEDMGEETPEAEMTEAADMGDEDMGEETPEAEMTEAADMGDEDMGEETPEAEMTEAADMGDEDMAEETPAAEETEMADMGDEDMGEEPGTITEIVVAAATAEEDAEFTALLSAIEASGTVADLLNEEGPFTVFAPTDAAFAQFPPSVLEALLSSPISIQSTLAYHVVEGAVMAADVVELDGEEVPTLLDGETITITVDEDGNVFINETIQVIQTDIEASNGVIHVIDGVILPTIPDAAPDVDAMMEETEAADMEEDMAEETPEAEMTEEAAMGDEDMGEMMDALVNVSSNDELGDFLVAADGMTLYQFTPDDANCTGECLEAWPPLTVESEDELTLAEGLMGELSIYEREDGTMQVAYDGVPLYFFVQDEAPGDVTGQGVNDVWFVVAPVMGEDMGDAEMTEEAPMEEDMAEETPEAEMTEEAAMDDEEMADDGDMDEPMGMDMAGSATSACLVTDQGGVQDGTFNELAANGLNRAAEDFGLETTIIESVEPSDFAPNINTCLDGGADVVITVGFLITDATLSSALENPEVFFIGVDQFFADHPDNLVGIQYREDQAGFLVGVMAARMTETDTIGGVYGVEIPPVIKFRNGYEQGARYVNPDINVLGVYIDSFTDTTRGAEVAQTLIGEDADVIFGAGGATGSAGIQRAAAEDVLAIGVDQDEYFTTFEAGAVPGAENLITSATKAVDVGVYDMLDALTEGNVLWAGGDIYILQASNGGIGFAPSHDADVPQEVIDEVNMVFEMLASGELDTGVDGLSGELLDASEDDMGDMMEEEATEEPMMEEATEEAMMEEEAEMTPEATEEGLDN